MTGYGKALRLATQKINKLKQERDDWKTQCVSISERSRAVVAVLNQRIDDLSARIVALKSVATDKDDGKALEEFEEAIAPKCAEDTPASVNRAGARKR